MTSLRLWSTQQAERFESRRDFLLKQNGQIDLKKIPIDTIKFGGGNNFPESNGTASVPPPTHVAAASTVAGSSDPAAGDFDEDALRRLFEEDENEAKAMGLESALASAKAKAKAKSKPKRTRQEVIRDEMAKVRGELAATIDSLSSFPDGPKSTEVGRLDRVLNRKAKEYTESCEFEPAQECQNMFKRLATLRDAMKPSQAYISGTTATRRKACGEFYDKMKSLRESCYDIFLKFPPTVRASFDDLHLTKLMETNSWEEVGSYLSQADGSEGTVSSYDLLERLLGMQMNKPDQTPELALQIGAELGDILLSLCSKAQADFQPDLQSIACVVAAKPSPGKQTLEDPLAMVMQNPTKIGFRVLHNTACGQELLKQASLENARLVAVRDGEESLAGSEEFFKGIFGIEAVTTLLEKGESNDSSVLENTLQTFFSKVAAMNAIIGVLT